MILLNERELIMKPIHDLPKKKRNKMDEIQARKVYLDRRDTKDTINGIRIAVSAGFEASILDFITTKDGMITLDSINHFLSEYVEDCVPPVFDITIREALEEYICTYVTLHILIALSNYRTNVKDVIYEFDSDKLIIDAHSLVDLLVPTPDGYRLNTLSNNYSNLRRALSFSSMINRFEVMVIAQTKYELIKTFLNLKQYINPSLLNDPFKQLTFENYYAFQKMKLPALPNMIKAAMIDGLDVYCDNNGISLRVRNKKTKAVINEHYNEIISELDYSLNSIANAHDRFAEGKNHE